MTRRLGPLVLAVVVTALLVFVACFLVWHHLGGGAWRGEVEVREAFLVNPQRLELIVSSCNGAPRVTVRETLDEIQVKVIAYSTPSRGGDDCLDSVVARLLSPLGDRAVVDRHTGQVVRVTNAQ